MIIKWSETLIGNRKERTVLVRYSLLYFKQWLLEKVCLEKHQVTSQFMKQTNKQKPLGKKHKFCSAKMVEKNF